MLRSARRFSLVEIVFATGIITVVLLSLMALLLGSQRLQRVSSERTQAEALAGARLAQLRAFLRQAPNDGQGQRFKELIDSIGAVTSGGTGLVGASPPSPAVSTITNQLDTTGGVAADLVLGRSQDETAELKVPATVWVQCILNEATAQTTLGKTNLDLDGDGVTGENATAPAADGDLGKLHYLPVRVVVRWRPGDDPNGAGEVVVSGLLY